MEKYLVPRHLNFDTSYVVYNLDMVGAYCQGLEHAGIIRAYGHQSTRRYRGGSEIFWVRFELLDDGKKTVIDHTFKEKYKAVPESDAEEFMAKTFSERGWGD